MIELNGIQISDNNINTKKNVKIYVDEKQLNNKVGELSDLETTNKSSIVNAINEVKNTTDTLQIDVNRIYSDFTIIPNTPTEQEFTYKKSDEGVIEKGVAVIDNVKGNSVVWNQLWRKEWASTAIQSGITFTNNGDGSYTANGTANGDIDFYAFIVPVISDHKYLFKGCPQGGGENTYSFRLSSIGYDYGEGKIGTNSQTQNTAYEFHFTNGVTCSNLVFRPQIIDLTQMFGAGNEPTTYEEFLSRKPKVADEFAYNEGTIVNNKVEKVVTTGRNLWDEEWELGTIAWSGVEVVNNTRIRSSFVPIFANTTYYLRCGSVRYEVFFYDANKSFISYCQSSVANGTFTTPNGAVYLRFTTNSNYTETTYNHDICLNLSDESFNGQYAPYEKHELDLSWIKEIKDAEGVKFFEDGLKSAGTAYDEVRKNKAVKRFGVKVFDGTENVAYVDTSVQNNKTCITYFDKERIIFPNRTSKPNPHICNKFPYLGNVSAKAIALANNVVGSYGYYSNANTSYYYMYFVVNGIITIDSWKAHLADLYAQGNPLVVYYELSEPVEVEYDEKNLTYPVIAGGTEEAIASEPSTPMRASITYGSNTVATILSLMNRVNELERKIIN